MQKNKSWFKRIKIDNITSKYPSELQELFKKGSHDAFFLCMSNRSIENNAFKFKLNVGLTCPSRSQVIVFYLFIVLVQPPDIYLLDKHKALYAVDSYYKSLRNCEISGFFD